MISYVRTLDEVALRVLQESVAPGSLDRAVGAIVASAALPVRLPKPTLLRAIFAHLPVQGPQHALALAAPVATLEGQVGERLQAGELGGLIPPRRDAHACAEWSAGFLAVVDQIALAEEPRPVLASLTQIAALTDRLEPHALQAALGAARNVDELRAMVRGNLEHHLRALLQRWAPRRRKSAHTW